MPNVPLDPYVTNISTVPNVTPFTFRDGVSYTQKFERLVAYVNRVVIPYINENVAGLVGVFEGEVNRMIAEVNAALETQDTEVDQKIADLTVWVEQQIQAIVDNNIEAQDPLMASIFNNPASQTRIVTDTLYTSDARGDAIEATLNTGRLSSSTLDGRFNAKVDLTAYNTNKTATDTAIAAKVSQTAYDANKTATDAAIAAKVDLVNAVDQSLKVQRGGSHLIGLFQRLRDGIRDTNMNTRVVILGDSHGNGGLTTYTEQLWPLRLAYRAGAADYRRLEDYVAPAPAGMRWWNGAVGGQTTSNYYASAYPALITSIAPQYVIHFVGANDWANSVSTATITTNITNVCTSIEAAVPGVINVIIHGAQRRDVTPSGPTWAQYGTAMKSIADAKPSQRVYIDLDDVMGLFGMGTNNFAGMLSDDNIHFNNMSSKFVADILSKIMGIPSENEYAPNSDVRRVALANSANVGTGGLILTTTTIRAVNYPRVMSFKGGVYGESTAPQSELYAKIRRTADAVVLRERAWRWNPSGGVVLSTVGEFYIPPKVEVDFVMNMVVPSGTVNYIKDANGVYSSVELDLRPV